MANLLPFGGLHYLCFPLWRQVTAIMVHTRFTTESGGEEPVFREARQQPLRLLLVNLASVCHNTMTMGQTSNGVKRPERKAMKFAVQHHFINYPEPGETADILRQTFQCALGSKDMDAWTPDERSKAFDHMEGVIALLDQLGASMN